MRTILEHIDWNDKMKNKTGAESWNILKSELDSVSNIYIPMKKQGKRWRFINILERIRIMKFTKRH